MSLAVIPFSKTESAALDTDRLENGVPQSRPHEGLATPLLVRL